MKIYVDSANIPEILAAIELGLCDGVTTNPTLIAKENKAHEQAIRDICEVVDGPVHAEVLSLELEKMLKEGRQLASIASNVIVKIPMIHEGLKAVKVFHDEGIKTNVTLIFSPCQAMLAAKAGATYVCPFVGRLDDHSHEGTSLVADIADIFANYKEIKTQIIVASIRSPLHVIDSALSGAEIFTIPSKVLTQMEKHPLTDIGVAKFLEDAKRFI